MCVPPVEDTKTVAIATNALQSKYTVNIGRDLRAYTFTGGAEPWATLIPALNTIAEEEKAKLARRAADAEEKPAPAAS